MFTKPLPPVHVCHCFFDWKRFLFKKNFGFSRQNRLLWRCLLRFLHLFFSFSLDVCYWNSKTGGFSQCLSFSKKAFSGYLLNFRGVCMRKPLPKSTIHVGVNLSHCRIFNLTPLLKFKLNLTLLIIKIHFVGITYQKINSESLRKKMEIRRHQIVGFLPRFQPDVWGVRWT